MEKINEHLILALKHNTPPKENTVDTLINIVPMSKEAAYRRLRNEIPFSLNEAVRICSYLKLSFDELIQVKNNNAFTFHINSMFTTKTVCEFEKMMHSINRAFEIISREPNGFVYSVEFTLPMMFTVKYEMIIRLLLFRWCYQIDPSSAPQKLASLRIPKKYTELQMKCIDKVQHITSHLVLNKDVFNLYARDILYLEKLQMITKEEVLILKEEILSLIDDIELATRKKNFPQGGKVNIYVSDAFFDSSYMYMEGNDLKASAMRLYGINYLSTTNPQMCANQKKWIESLIRFSTLISECGEIQRVKFFKEQKEIINSQL